MNQLEASKYRVGDYCIGGILGECPTWLVGSIFYMGDKLLTSSGFDRNSAREKVEEAISICEKHGLVLALDVVFPREELVDDILSFVGEFNIPLFLDSPDPAVRAKAYLRASEMGLKRLSIANGLYVDSPREELEALRNSGIETSVLMAFDPRDPYTSIEPEKRLQIVRRLLDTARDTGVKNVLVDTVVLDPSSIYLSGEAIRRIKSELKLPSGSAPANALGGATKERLGVEGAVGVHGGAAAFLRMMGADFVMYGPVSRAKYVAPVVSMVDSLLGYGLRRSGVRIEGKHPVKALLKELQQIFTRG
ncbi:tetrahydromethanopterin S-methyltransferase subunit H [Thermogladius sp.]|uniref:tetrahydromethanopterin S-methyltransferase subunit H n=1 Tax=Thermogladius sp. TaxID=2023064 RepID=UPI003D140735